MEEDRFIEAAQNPIVVSAVEAASKLDDERPYGFHLSKLSTSCLHFDEIFSFQTLSNGLTLLTSRDTGDEAIFFATGMITQCMLPPVQRDQRFTGNFNKALDVSQSVSIVGAGVPVFNDALFALNSLFDYFEEQFSVGVVVGRPSLCCGDYPLIKASTRYLKLSSDPVFQPIDIDSRMLDPHNILRQVTNTGRYKHTEDNTVEFWERSRDKLQSKRADPNIFRVGQIVRVGITVRTDNRGQRKNFLVGLESVTLESRVGISVIKSLQQSTSKITEDVHSLLTVPRKRRAHPNLDGEASGKKRQVEDTPITEQPSSPASSSKHQVKTYGFGSLKIGTNDVQAMDVDGNRLNFQ